MPNRNYVFIFVVVFLFAASFGAWRDEHHNRIAAETAVATNRVENTPSLIPVPEARAITDVGEEKKNSVLVVIMTIKNLGAPSVADRFALVAETKAGSIQGIPVPPAEVTILNDHNGAPRIKLKRSDYLPEKATNQPIPRGGEVKGFFLMYVPDVTREEIEKGRVDIKGSFEDVMGKTYVFNLPYGGPQMQFLDADKLMQSPR